MIQKPLHLRIRNLNDLKFEKARLQIEIFRSQQRVHLLSEKITNPRGKQPLLATILSNIEKVFFFYSIYVKTRNWVSRIFHHNKK